MQNYHTHTSYSNVFTSFKDSHMQYENYAKRAKETGCSILSSVEHGFQGNHPRCWEMAQKYGLKFVFGTEAYWVRDRKAADRSNAHIIILARNRNGFLQINEMLSQANEDGFYYVPRVDLDLLCGLNPADVWVTTACVSFWGKVSREDGTVAHHEGIMDSFEQLAKHFGSSLHLEVQAHNTDWQRYVNRLCLSLRARFGLKLVAGCDSHYVSRDQEVEREILREESHVKSDLDHERDSGVYEDYPDEPTLRQRFAEQGVLTPAQIDEAIATTDEILSFDELTYDTSRKLPTIYPELTQEQRNQLYLDKVWSAWDKRKDAIMADGKAIYNAFIGMGVSPDDMEIPTEERYLEAIRYETGIVTSTNTSDYFLLDSELVACGRANGGHLTPTGRGSAGSFFTNTLLGLSTLDRISFPVKLYPDRFVTAERLQTSLPDIDLNVDDQAPFAEAQEELLGKGHSYPMIAYGTLKTKSAFKLYARAANLEAQTANVVSTQIERYERALQYAEEDDKDLIALEDYVEPKYIPYIENSEPYLGIVVSKSPHPCGYLIYNGDIRSEIGLMRVTSKAGSKSVLCTVIDGATADAFGYVKNDLLVVAVIKINAQTMQRAGLPQYSSQEMILLTANDAKTWDVFANGWTQGINQCQRAATTQKLMQYKPRELRDLCAFVAAIRPGFKTQIQQFLARQRFRYGVPAFDRILRNDSSGSAWMLYQENAMTALNLAGFDMARTYPIIKAISKKKTKVIEAAHDEFAEGFKRYLTEKQRVSKANAEKQTELVWKVIADSANYSYNASHAGCVSLDALYGAYLKAHYPHVYYEVLLEDYLKKGNKPKISEIKQEMQTAYGIRVVPCRFRQDNRRFVINREANYIADSLASVKSVSQQAANALYALRDRQFESFVDVLWTLSETKGFNKTVVDVLIGIGYFAEFGGVRKLKAVAEEFRGGKQRYTKQLVASSKVKRLEALREIERGMEDEDISPREHVALEIEHYGFPMTRDPKAHNDYAIVEVSGVRTLHMRLYNMRTGQFGTAKVSKQMYTTMPVSPGEVIHVCGWSKRPAYGYAAGVRVKLPYKEVWISEYQCT